MSAVVPVRIVSGGPSDPMRISGPLPSPPNVVSVGPTASDFTTIQAAINSIIGASQTNPYQVNVAPDEYVENLTGAAWVNVFAPSARLVGNHIMGDNAKWVFGEMLSTTPGSIILTKTGTAMSILECERITVPANSIGLLNVDTTSILFARIGRMFVGAGSFGLGDIATGFGHTHLTINDLYLTGDNAIGIGALGNKVIVGYIDHVLEINAPLNVTAVVVFTAGVVRLSILEVIGIETLYNVDATGVLDLIIGITDAARVQAGGAQVRENGLPTTNPGPGLVWVNNGVPTVGS